MDNGYFTIWGDLERDQIVLDSMIYILMAMASIQMNLNGGSDYSVRSIYFTSNATVKVENSILVDGRDSLNLSASNSVDPKIENNSSATHSFECTYIVMTNWCEINPVSGDLLFYQVILMLTTT